jgi:uncharacterized peroxidase-related enzyme
MPRLNPVDPKTATGQTKELLDGVQSKLGMVPNLMRTFANSPAVLKAYLGFGDALASGVLPARLREQIALLVSELNSCDYCLAAHSALGRMQRLSDEELLDSRRGTSTDARTEAALTFAQRVVEARGWVSDDDLAAVREGGYSDEEVSEIVGQVLLITFSNTFNHVAETAVDFPPVPALAAS